MLENNKIYLAEKLHEEVFLYENAIEDPKTLIKMIEDLDSVDEVHAVIPPWGRWLSNSNDGKTFGAKKDFNPDLVNTISEEYRETVQYIISEIQSGVKKVAEAYFKDREFDYEPNLSPFVGIMKYRPGCAMGAHFDAQAGDRTLKYSIVLYLNDDYEGGEISFIVRDYDLRDPEYSHLKPAEDIEDAKDSGLIDFWRKPKAGSALIFPSTHPYKHQVHIMKSGDKYMFPGFIFHPEYDQYDEESRKFFNAGSQYEPVVNPYENHGK
jgi:2OG-Fe(II) oxygenase superfamily